MSQMPMSDFRSRTYTPVPDTSISVQVHGDEADRGRIITSQTGRSTYRQSPEDPPSYREVTTRDKPRLHTPLIYQDSTGFPTTRPPASAPPEDLLKVRDTDPDPDTACVRACDTECTNPTGLFRLVVLLCIAAGFGLLYWEAVYRSSVGNDYWQRKQIGLRLGFGCVILFFAVGMYVVDVFRANGPFRGLLSIVPKAHLLAHLDYVAKARPTIKWDMKCFHQDNRHVTITLPNGTSRTEHHNEKVIAWSGQEIFQFGSWEDVSPGDQLSKSGSYQTVTFNKEYILVDEKTKASYLAQKEAFVNSNSQHDREYSIEETFELEGFRPTMLARTSSRPSVTLNPCIYILFALGFLAYLWSFIIRLGARRVTYTHIKKLTV